MFFKISLYTSLGIFLLGLSYKVSTWLSYRPDPRGKGMEPSHRLRAVMHGIGFSVLSKKSLYLLKVLFLNILLQMKILQESTYRWITHMCLFWGFMMLLLMHALDALITSGLFAGYAATLNPFLFLRNFFGALVIVGLGMVLYRRLFLGEPRRFTTAMDHYAIIILGVIVVSGILLEGTKLISSARYQEMVEAYADEDEPGVLRSLEGYWVKEFGLVSPRMKGPFDTDLLAKGRALHESSCASCHSRPQWAFMSYGVSKALRPIAARVQRNNLPQFLWLLHFTACFIGLAYLPFSKMFHIIASPLTMMANAVMEEGTSDPANIATRQVMELDACTHCGACTSRCAVGVAFEEVSNINILPSEKMASVKALISGKSLSDEQIQTLQEGLYLCTNCTRCTEVCPVGINLQDLWFNVREALLQRGYPELLSLSPLSFFRGLKRGEEEQDIYREPLKWARRAVDEACTSIDPEADTLYLRDADKTLKTNLTLSGQGRSYSYCFTCTTCTTACPVVQNNANTPETLGLVPHQIIRAANVGLGDLIFKSEMLWSCLGCYQCQEHCPQGVRVTDIFYELKSLANKKARDNMQRT